MKKDNHTNTNFWFGFALGSITLSAVAYLIGTKKGREKLQQLIEYADTVHDLPEEFFEILPKIKELLHNEGENVVEYSKSDESIPTKLEHSFETLLEKVKSTAEQKK